MTRKKSASPNSAKGPTQRMLRIGELIRHKIAEMLSRAEIHDDVLAAHVITIPEVRISPDLKVATVYVMPLGGKSIKPVIESLTRNKKYIRTEVAHTLNLDTRPTCYSTKTKPSRKRPASTACWTARKCVRTSRRNKGKLPLPIRCT